MTKLIDMTGKRFGRLIVLQRGQNDKHNKAQWWCQCDCGSPKKLISGAALRQGLVVSCGCKRQQEMQKHNKNTTIDETGNRYGKLVVLNQNFNPQFAKDGRAMWNCKCDCGNICVVSGKLLRTRHVSSCGCSIKSVGEKQISLLLKNANLNFSQQYKIIIQQFEYQLKQPHPYYFDFAVFQNNILKYLIEYDGQQHFIYKNTNSHWNNKQNYQQTVLRDNIKNQWCKQNNIPLIRIPYTHLKNLCIEDLLLETSNFII